MRTRVFRLLVEQLLNRLFEFSHVCVSQFVYQPLVFGARFFAYGLSPTSDGNLGGSHPCMLARQCWDSYPAHVVIRSAQRSLFDDLLDGDEEAGS